MILPTLLAAFLPLASTSLDEADPALNELGCMEYITLESAALDGAWRAGVYLPPGYSEDQEYPVVYFLHGMNGSERTFEERRVHRQLDKLILTGDIPALLMVCPTGRNAMWVNWIDGTADWEDAVVEDLVPAIDERFSTRADPASRGLMGDSMGGYGALLIGLQNPDVFGSVTAHSAALYPVDPDDLPAWVKANIGRWGGIYGNPVDEEFWKEKNPLHLAASLDSEPLARLDLYFDCGSRDRFGFHKTGEQLHEILQGREIEHEYHLRDGDHGSQYFRENVKHSLRFHAQTFGRAAGAAH